jgi:hypothetical protein
LQLHFYIEGCSELVDQLPVAAHLGVYYHEWADPRDLWDVRGGAVPHVVKPLLDHPPYFFYIYFLYFFKYSPMYIFFLLGASIFFATKMKNQNHQPTKYRIFPNKRTSAFIFRLTFSKKIMDQKCFNSHFSFFFGLIRLEGVHLCVYWEGVIWKNTVHG